MPNQAFIFIMRMVFVRCDGDAMSDKYAVLEDLVYLKHKVSAAKM